MHNDGINWHNLHRIQVAVGAIQRTKPLASGAFGTIWLGTYMNETVAVKTCSKSTRTDIQTFLDELDLMSSLKCPFIVALLAAAWTKATDVHAALEYMPMGDLRDFLTRSKGLSTPPWAEKIAIAIHVVKALVYLKANGIIHRDLKSRNVLLDETTGAKLADFGISRRATDASMSCGVGTYRWIAPEVLAHRHYTVAVDVFSFGVLLTELDTHELPYWDVVQDKRSSSNASIVWRVLHENLRPTFTAQCPQWIVDLATACMHFDPARRPVPEQILGLLETRQCGEAP
ncbi:hypothetical protein DYB32_008672 [Aphanomyces invadans]|uniref:Protein kinase domain-containing protein n=1 Tax=Aphanomyces invadans TaxID=157072 RepID=A0A3R6VGA9_9STRA|nr:hypothetical protein DYB32_008672 [Aphanomyces invadans]